MFNLQLVEIVGSCIIVFDNDLIQDLKLFGAIDENC